jgi:hypothetical protein
MASKYDCSICRYYSSRRANLKRHYRLVHGQTIFDNDNTVNLNYKQQQKMLFDKEEKNAEGRRLRWDEIWDYPEEFAKFHNTMANSKQTNDRISNLQWQVSSLQQQIISFQNYFSGLMSHNFLVSKKSIRGMSGYICQKCNTLGLKSIFDLGYDMTMKSRHQCYESPDERDYQSISIP